MLIISGIYILHSSVCIKMNVIRPCVFINAGAVLFANRVAADYNIIMEENFQEDLAETQENGDNGDIAENGAQQPEKSTEAQLQPSDVEELDGIRAKLAPEKFFTKPLVVALCAIFCCVLWGSAFPCVKLGYRLFAIDADSPASLMLFAGVRFSLAGVLVIVFGCIQKRGFLAPKPRNMWRVLLVALFQTAMQYTFFYIGLAHTSGVKSSVLNGLGVFFTILCACFIFRTEKFNLIKLAGCVLGFAGVILINLGGDFTFTFKFTGEGFLILSGLSSAMAAGLCKDFFKARKHYRAVWLSVSDRRRRSHYNRFKLRRKNTADKRGRGVYAVVSGVSFGVRVHLAGLSFEVQPRIESGCVQEH